MKRATEKKATTRPVTVDVTRETLDDTPARALKLLRGIGTCRPARAALAARGYADADHREGWELLQASSGYATASDFGSEFDQDVRAAIAAIDAWDEDGFRIVRATLKRRFPELLAEVTEGIGPSTGPAAVVGVETLLDRLDALGKSTAKDARAAIALLATRGIDAAERARLRALVTQAQQATLVEPDPKAGDSAAAEAAHVEALAGLRAWYEEWSAIARAAIKRRDRLILLGLAQRKSRRTAAGQQPPAGPPQPAPLPSA